MNPYLSDLLLLGPPRWDMCAPQERISWSNPGCSRRIAAPEEGIRALADDDRLIVRRSVSLAPISLMGRSFAQRSAASGDLAINSRPLRNLKA